MYKIWKWCGKRMTVDHVDFECRIVKALWQVFAQAIGLNMKALIPQTQTGIPGCNTVPFAVQKKERHMV